MPSPLTLRHEEDESAQHMPAQPFLPEAHLAETGAAIAAHPEVAFCAATTGPTNLLISVVCRDSRDLYRYLTERLGTLPLIGEVQTAPVIRVVKRAGRRP